jgi:hypothetical protein
VNKTSPSVSFIIFPVTFIKGAIHPDLNPTAIFMVLIVPLSLVFSPVVECDQGSLNPTLPVRAHGWLVVKGF